MNPQENKDRFTQIKRHPLFQGVSSLELERLIEKCNLKDYEKSEKVLYSKTPREGLLLILSGMAEVFIQDDKSLNHQEVLEILETGDIIGFSSLADFLGEPNHHPHSYTVEVRALAPCSCLQIPYSVIEERWHDDSVRDYILRQVAVRLRDIYGSLAEQVKLANQWGESEAFIRRICDVMNGPVVSVQEQEPIQKVAETMATHSVSSVVVLDEQQHLKGIITEKDLVVRVIAADKRAAVAEDIMSKNPVTISHNAYYYEAMSTFLMSGIKHLPVVDKQKVIGMVTMADLLRKKNHGTLEIVQTIEESSYETLPNVKFAIYDVLQQLLHDEIPIIHTLEMITKLYDRLLSHSVDLAVKQLEQTGHGRPPAPFCFYAMGSGGRAEQFLLTDQDHFLVYGEGENSESYFARLGQAIVDHLEHAGYKKCDGKMMASEENWRGSIPAWQTRLRNWALRATNDNILLAQNFLSFRLIHGDQRLHDQFVKEVKTQVQQSRIFFYRMAEIERDQPVPMLDHPVRALFRKKRKSIDIKKDALFPFHHSLQMLAAKHHIVEGTPLQKLETLKKENILSESTVDEVKYAYSVVLHTRVTQGWSKYKRNEQSTSEIVFTRLRSREKEELMLALKAIRNLQQHTIAEFGMM
ncbi:DUF294 nucleotidyltransferase-like domain-containing protein [Bacillus alkalicellulosilyticus]|uniref:DUF294 nucleotidyltransferase-like domain-containing protein n=1 Tax=Alkalihalobacterium alkalicellulosilyticum TaxID=1912214 RepID=UPI0009963E4A|nr:DUF294 nucleotidyltransferase-like domain-containing protein [Bacillus alkalicellulosilyticus]